MKDNNFLVDNNLDNTKTAVKNSSKSNNKYIIAMIMLLLLVVGISAFFFFNKNTQIKNEPQINEPVFLDFPEIIVNLNTATNENVYLKLSLVLSLSNNAEVQKIEFKLSKIKDNLETFLRELRPADFSLAGSTIILKEEITKRINAVISPIKIKEVLFKSILVN